MWHQEQALAAGNAKSWYAATFHYASLMNDDPGQASYYDGLRSSYDELKLQFEQDKRDLEPCLTSIIREALKHTCGDEPASTGL